MQITNTYQKYQSRSDQELENIILYVVHQFTHYKITNISACIHIFVTTTALYLSTYYKYVVYVTNDHTLEERIL